MGFVTEPKVGLLHGGEYVLLEEVYYFSEKVYLTFHIPAGFEFSPSIPTMARVFVPVTSDIVAASLPHDFLYKTAAQGVTQHGADLVGREELENRNVNIHIIIRFYYALRLLGWVAWNKNRKQKKEQRDS